MSVIFHHTFDDAAVQAMLKGRNGPVVKDMMRRGYRVQRRAKQLCPVDHGRLRASIHTQVVAINGVTGVEVGTDVDYALWVHEGTGLYGPHRTRVVSPRGGVMVFQNRKAFQTGVYIPKKHRTTFFVRSTRGMKGRPFLKNALPTASQ